DAAAVEVGGALPDGAAGGVFKQDTPVGAAREEADGAVKIKPGGGDAADSDPHRLFEVKPMAVADGGTGMVPRGRLQIAAREIEGRALGVVEVGPRQKFKLFKVLRTVQKLEAVHLGYGIKGSGKRGGVDEP